MLKIQFPSSCATAKDFWIKLSSCTTSRSYDENPLDISYTMPELGLVQVAWRNPIWGIGVQNLKAAEHRTIRHLNNVSGGLRPGAWLASRGSIPLKPACSRT
jgi:hypothetical protein